MDLITPEPSVVRVDASNDSHEVLSGDTHKVHSVKAFPPVFLTVNTMLGYPSRSTAARMVCCVVKLVVEVLAGE